MLDKLPVELAGEVLRTAAEMFLLSDRKTLLAMSLSSSFAYITTTPVLYRTLIIERQDGDPAMRVFALNSDVQTVASRLHEPPAQRLCPLVRRVFIEWGGSFDLSDLRHLVNLEALYCLRRLDSAIAALSPPSLKQYYSLAPEMGSALAASLTHVSFYVQLHDFQAATWSSFLERASTFPASIAFIALEINEGLRKESSVGVHKMLLSLLVNQTRPVEIVFRLYRHAKRTSSVRVVHRAIHALGDTNIQSRVKIWRDFRPMKDDDEDVEVSKEDAVVGRTPWTEAESVTPADLKESVAGLENDRSHEISDDESDDESDKSA